jgi:flagellar basal-body rod modification protein FlgD
MSSQITATAAGAGAAPPSLFGRAGSADQLGKQEFLKLLIAQLRNQDPMKPMEDREFITQLAQFSSLESMQSLEAHFQVSFGVQLLAQTAGFIGKQVDARLADGSTVSGVVSEVRFSGGVPQLIVNEQAIDLTQITKVGGQGAS